MVVPKLIHAAANAALALTAPIAGPVTTVQTQVNKVVAATQGALDQAIVNSCGCLAGECRAFAAARPAPMEYESKKSDSKITGTVLSTPKLRGATGDIAMTMRADR